MLDLSFPYVVCVLEQILGTYEPVEHFLILQRKLLPL